MNIIASCLCRYLDTCQKNSVISFSQKGFGFRVRNRVRVEVRASGIRFRSNVHSGKCNRSVCRICGIFSRLKCHKTWTIAVDFIQ